MRNTGTQAEPMPKEENFVLFHVANWEQCQAIVSAPSFGSVYRQIYSQKNVQINTIDLTNYFTFRIADMLLLSILKQVPNHLLSSITLVSKYKSYIIYSGFLKPTRKPTYFLFGVNQSALQFCILQFSINGKEKFIFIYLNKTAF